MRKTLHALHLLGLGLCLLIAACSKENELVPDNDAPVVNNIPRIKIENYVNRVFIDLLGREPIDTEMDREVIALKNAGLSKSARRSLVRQLQTGTSLIEGDSTYQRAYHQYLYNLAKVRCIEGVSDETIAEFIAGAPTPADEARLLAVISSRQDMENGLITFDQMMGRMIYNMVYDELNMNTFNFVNASFENLLWRFPTDAEFDEGFRMVEFNASAELFGQVGQNKTDYVNILTNSREMFEGLIIWAYRQLLSRQPNTGETTALLEDFYEHRDIRLIQQEIMITDEYANFE